MILKLDICLSSKKEEYWVRGTNHTVKPTQMMAKQTWMSKHVIGIC